MELSISGQLRAARQSGRVEGKRRESESASAPAPQPRTDRLSLTRQAVEQLEEQSRRISNLLTEPRPEKKMPALWELDGAAGEGANTEPDVLGESLKTMQRCQKIAARIMRGDKVPPQDEQYLMQNDPNGYKLALAMRKPKKHPKKWESVLKDEEKRTRQEQDGGETAEEVSAGGESGEASGSGGEGTPSGGE